MKKQLFNIRRIFIGLALTGMMAAITSTTFAGGRKRMVKPAINIAPSIEHVGTYNAETLLHVSFETEAPVRFELSVKDEGGEVLFTNEYEAAKFSKYLKLVNEDGETALKLTVSIRTMPNGRTYTFGVTTEDKFVKEILVTKL